jgi:hypothetical protein
MMTATISPPINQLKSVALANTVWRQIITYE